MKRSVSECSLDDTYQHECICVSQCLLGEVSFALDFNVQTLGDVRNADVNESTDAKDDMLQEHEAQMNIQHFSKYTTCTGRYINVLCNSSTHSLNQSIDIVLMRTK